MPKANDHKIVVTADWHLDKFSRTIPEFLGLQVKAIDKMAELAAEVAGSRFPGMVIVAGDVFDSPSPSQAALVALWECLCRHPNVTFYFLAGNHDRTSDEFSSLDLFAAVAKSQKGQANFVVIKTPTSIKFGPAADRKSLWLAPFPYCDNMPKNHYCAVGHMAWTGAKTETGYVTASGKTPTGRWLLGDYHVAQHGPRYLYVGSPYPLSFSDTSSKTVCVIRADRSAKDSVENLVHERVGVSDIQFKRVTINGKGDWDSLTESHARSEADVFYHVTFVGPEPAGWQKDGLPVVVSVRSKQTPGAGSDPTATAAMDFSALASVSNEAQRESALAAWTKRMGLTPEERRNVQNAASSIEAKVRRGRDA